jgi:hypothetical protein
VTDILARRSESAKTAAELWREARRDFLILLRRVQTRKPLTAPEGLRVISEINDLEEHYIVILRRLAHDADQEYRAYAETAYLLASPANAKRLKEALEETRSGKLDRLGGPQKQFIYLTRDALVGSLTSTAQPPGERRQNR